MKRILPGLLAAALTGAVAPAQAAGTMVTTPEFPSFSQPVSMKLRENAWPIYIPTASYERQGNTFTFHYDGGDGFAASNPGMGNLPILVGELPPSTYTAHTRVSNLSNPSAAPEVTTSYFTVFAPTQPDAYAIPAQPKAYNRWHAMVSSAYYLYPASLRAAVSGSVVRVAFEYEPGSPTTGPGPSGTAAFASIALDGLPSGAYTLEFTGTPKGGSTPTLQYRKAITVRRVSEVAEYYNETTGHYFISGGPGEMAGLDAPGSGWRRTGEGFNAFLAAADTPPDAAPVCRFYAPGANSHFYTADAGECGYLKAIEERERAGGKQYSGWNYEGIAFHAIVPAGGTCPAGTTPVYRFYNNRWRENDSNHRFPTTRGMYNTMKFGSSWADEGVAFCSPS